MPKQRERDLNHQKSLFVLLKVISIPRIFQRNFAVFISVLLLSSIVATPGRMGISLAQQPAAHRIFQEGWQLYQQGTAESLRQAIAKWEEALPLYRAVGDKKQEAVTLNNIGGVYDALGQKQKALDYYNQSLPLSRAVGDKKQEAVTLNNIGGVYDALGQK
jgi:tetratricopeptide (TPR) repeat protein